MTDYIIRDRQNDGAMLFHTKVTEFRQLWDGSYTKFNNLMRNILKLKRLLLQSNK